MNGARTARTTSKIPNFEDIEQEDETVPRRPERTAFNGGLNEFLGQLHETSETGETNGMPTLAWIKSTFQTKSGAIRHLFQKGFTPQQISSHLGIKYQHAYNVCHQNLKRGPNEVYTEQVQQCPHMDAEVLVDVILRRGTRDPDSSRILYRVCSKCAVGLIPGVTDESIKAHLPGVKES